MTPGAARSKFMLYSTTPALSSARFHHFHHSCAPFRSSLLLLPLPLPRSPQPFLSFLAPAVFLSFTTMFTADFGPFPGRVIIEDDLSTNYEAAKPYADAASAPASSPLSALRSPLPSPASSSPSPTRPAPIARTTRPARRVGRAGPPSGASTPVRPGPSGADPPHTYRAPRRPSSTQLR